MLENVVRCPKFPLDRTSSGEMNPRDAQKVFFKCYFLRKLGKSVVKPCHQSTLLLLTNGAVNICSLGSYPNWEIKVFKNISLIRCAQHSKRNFVSLQ